MGTIKPSQTIPFSKSALVNSPVGFLISLQIAASMMAFCRLAGIMLGGVGCGRGLTGVGVGRGVTGAGVDVGDGVGVRCGVAVTMLVTTSFKVFVTTLVTTVGGAGGATTSARSSESPLGELCQ